MSDESRSRGEAVLRELWGQVPEGTAVTGDLMEVTVEHLFGDIWSRPGLALRDRSLITVAALTVLGREAQLKAHLKGALRIGISRDEVKEIMLHLAHYGGWPTGVTGLNVAAALFEELDSADA